MKKDYNHCYINFGRKFHIAKGMIRGAINEKGDYVFLMSGDNEEHINHYNFMSVIRELNEISFELIKEIIHNRKVLILANGSRIDFVRNLRPYTAGRRYDGYCRIN